MLVRLMRRSHHAPSPDTLSVSMSARSYASIGPFLSRDKFDKTLFCNGCWLGVGKFLELTSADRETSVA